MTKSWMAGVAALAVMTAPALAQSLSSESETRTQTTTSTVAPAPIGTYDQQKTEKIVDGNGTVIERSQTYSNNGAATVNTTSARRVMPDGTEKTYQHEERVERPLPPPPPRVETERTTTTGGD
jgi:hypothetical protein